MNGGLNALGSGNRANATIGRALRLTVRNALSAKTGQLDASSLGKPRARELLQMIAERLATRFGGADIRVFDKGSASRVIDDDEIARIAAASDAVIAGLGDCGACSACSLADALKMKGAGIPSTVLISDVFVGHIASFAATMGMPGYHSALVPHPVSSKDDIQLAAYATALVEQQLSVASRDGLAPDRPCPAEVQ